jgi:hypothetical protein
MRRRAVLLTHHPHKRKLAIEQTLVAFLRSEGVEVDADNGDISIRALAKDAPDVRVRVQDILSISLNDLAHELTEALR